MFRTSSTSERAAMLMSLTGEMHSPLSKLVTRTLVRYRPSPIIAAITYVVSPNSKGRNHEGIKAKSLQKD
jgi:hypothetical protein